MWTDHWLLPVVNNSQRTMGRVGFTLSDYKNMLAFFLVQNQNLLGLHVKGK